MDQGYTSWKKSSRSGSSNGDCVEVAREATVGIRDTKQKGSGPVLTVSREAWAAFVTEVTADGSPLARGI